MVLHIAPPEFPARGLDEVRTEVAASDELASAASSSILSLEIGVATAKAEIADHRQRNLRSLAWTLNRKTADQLHDLLEQEGLDSDGGKFTLVQRLVRHVRRSVNEAANNQETQMKPECKVAATEIIF